MELAPHEPPGRLPEDENNAYSDILRSASNFPQTDPKHAIMLGFSWWITHRRRRFGHQLQRRRRFIQRIRRLMHLRLQMQTSVIGELVSPLLENDHAHGRSPTPRSADLWRKLESGDIKDIDYLNHFHMSKDTFNYLFEELEDHLTKTTTTVKESLPAKKRLAATICRLATNAEYSKIADLFGIGKSTTTSLVRDVCKVIVSVLKEKYLNLQYNEDTISSAAKEFGWAQVVGVLGAIDVGTSGGASDPDETSGSYFSRYSQSPTLTFLAVVDHMGQFRYASAKCPGGSSNAEAVRKSDLPSLVQRNWSCHEKDVNGEIMPLFVFGDESYSSQGFSWIVTPIQTYDLSNASITSAAEKSRQLNGKIQKALEMFEEVITKMKCRWKVFHGKNGKINFNADAFENIALTCCILQNICEMRGDPIDHSWRDDVCDVSKLYRRGLSTSADDDNG